MPVELEQLTLSLDAELAAAIRGAAEEDAVELSAWFADAARHHLAGRGLADVIAEWEALHGDFTDVELDHAQQQITSPS